MITAGSCPAVFVPVWYAWSWTSGEGVGCVCEEQGGAGVYQEGGGDAGEADGGERGERGGALRGGEVGCDGV